MSVDDIPQDQLDGLSRRRMLALAGGAATSGLAVSGAATAQDTSEEVEDATEEYPQIVIFRDDDLSPGSDLDTVEAVYDIFRENEIPLTTGVIPTGEEEMEEDEQVATYLNDLDPDLFEIALHGFDHNEVLLDNSEFRGVSRVTQREKIVNGTAILESYTGQCPTTFIPPWNSHDETTAEVLREEGYEVLSSSTSQNEEYYGEGQLFVEDDLIYLGTDLDWVADWGTSPVELHSQEDLRAAFDSAREEGRVHVPLLHYHTLDSPDKRELIRSFIQYVDDYHVRYMTFREFAEKYQSGAVQQRGGRWTVVENGEE